MGRLLRIVAHRPWVGLGLIVLATLLAVSQIVDLSSGRLRIRIDPSTNRLLPEDSEDKRFYDFVRRLFGSDETMLVALSHERLFTPGILERVQQMTERFEALPEVHHVVSLTNALNIRGTEDGLDIRPFARPIPREADALARMRREVLENPVYGAATSPMPTSSSVGSTRRSPPSRARRRGTRACGSRVCLTSRSRSSATRRGTSRAARRSSCSSRRSCWRSRSARCAASCCPC
jgi:hypothetical protein